MAAISQHVIKDAGRGWIVKKGGALRASKHFDTQSEAIDWGRLVAKNQHAELYIHGIDGKIMAKDSYSNSALASKDRQ